MGLKVGRKTNNKQQEITEIKHKNLLIVILSVTILFLIDVVSKYYFANKTYFKGYFFYINPSLNSGSAFSMFSNVSFYNYLIGILGLIAALFLMHHAKKFISIYSKKNNFKLILSVYVLVLAGILGNTFDRLFFGFTRDFIGFGQLFIFNLADFYLTIAVILYLIYEFKSK